MVYHFIPHFDPANAANRPIAPVPRRAIAPAMHRPLQAQHDQRNGVIHAPRPAQLPAVQPADPVLAAQPALAPNPVPWAQNQRPQRAAARRPELPKPVRPPVPPGPREPPRPRAQPQRQPAAQRRAIYRPPNLDDWAPLGMMMPPVGVGPFHGGPGLLNPERVVSQGAATNDNNRGAGTAPAFAGHAVPFARFGDNPWGDPVLQ